MFELAEAADELEGEGEAGQASVLAMHKDIKASIAAIGTEIQGNALHLHLPCHMPYYAMLCYSDIIRLQVMSMSN